jgi:hypothetical protein
MMQPAVDSSMPYGDCAVIYEYYSNVYYNSYQHASR